MTADIARGRRWAEFMDGYRGLGMGLSALYLADRAPVFAVSVRHDIEAFLAEIEGVSPEQIEVKYGAGFVGLDEQWAKERAG